MLYGITTDNIIGIAHLSGMIFESIYGFIPGIHSCLFDQIYITAMLFLPFSWILCKGECYLSYWMKKRNDPGYILGSEPENVEDIISIFPSVIWYERFYHVNHILRIGSLISTYWDVRKRMDIIFLANMGMYSIYVYTLFYGVPLQEKIPLFPFLFSFGLGYNIIIFWWYP